MMATPVVFKDERLDLRPSKVGQRDVIGDVYEYLIGEESQR